MNFTQDPILEDRPVKRKAIQFENSLERQSIPNNKRVSFADKEIIFFDSIPLQIEELEQLITESNENIIKSQQNIDKSKAKLQFANNGIINLLDNLSNTMGITKQISDNEKEYYQNLIEFEESQVKQLQAQKEELLSMLNSQEKELLNELEIMKNQEKSLENNIKAIHQQEKFESKQYQGYKKIIGLFGIDIKSNDDEFTLVCNNSSFNIAPTGSSYMIAPNHDKLLLFSKGTHKICKSQLKYLTFRLLDN